MFFVIRRAIRRQPKSFPRRHQTQTSDRKKELYGGEVANCAKNQMPPQYQQRGEVSAQKTVCREIALDEILRNSESFDRALEHHRVNSRFDSVSHLIPKVGCQLQLDFHRQTNLQISDEVIETRILKRFLCKVERDIFNSCLVRQKTLVERMVTRNMFFYCSL